MTRGLHPPEALSDEDVYTLHAVRKNIFLQGLVGGGIGACSGFVLFTGAQWAKRYGFLQRSNLNRNVGMLVTLVGFAFGTFMGATVTGKEEVHNLHPIFRAAAMNPTMINAGGAAGEGEQQNLSYQAKWLEARKELEAGEGGLDGSDKSSTRIVDRERLQQMRMTRRRTLMNNLHQGHGLSDSHSGRWVEDNSETKLDKD